MKDLPKIVLTALITSFLTTLFVTGFQPEVQKIVEKIEQPIKVVENEKITKEEKIVKEESIIIDIVKKTSGSVVSIIVSKDLPKTQSFFPDDFFWPFQFQIPQNNETEKREIGGGTGFIVAENLILTNKHVASDSQAEYTIVTTAEKRYKADILALAPVFDIAILKAQTDLPPLPLGDSSDLEVGQTVVAIGNALGEFQNTVSVGVVSGLRRTIDAELRSLIQTDAAINQGNSGGPLINLKGEVIGINTAIAANAENIGFAIPINIAKKAINNAKTKGKIEYPFLGIRYNINDHLVLEITPGSAAEKAGLLPNDIILEFDNQKLSKDNTLADVILKYEPDQKIKLKILRNGQEKILYIVLGKR